MEKFPLWALLPKRETTVASFLAKYPAFDGRGVKIAILDSGVDPGADGLRVTSDGKVKVIDMMDASGAGDVDTSTVVEADSERCIKGLSGRALKIPDRWQNPSGNFHIGVKNVYELFVRPLRERMASEFTDNEFTPSHKSLQTEALRKLQAFKSNVASEQSLTDESVNDKSDTKSADNNSIKSIEEKLTKEDLQSRYDILNSIEKKFTDLGPTYDCVVFNDGNAWNAVIDTSGNGNLDECQLLTNYADCLKYGTISARDQLNYAVNIHNDGNLLEIVGMCSPHGTHVASIAAAYFPDEPDKNGVAPGAQIVSISIGDIRIGSMETGSALVRAFIKVIESGCHIINMSYGEMGHWPEGRVMDLLHDVVNKYGVIFVSSAGNRGPALTTIGSPVTMSSSSIISVGAYVSPDMMTAEYSMRTQLPGMGYSWTSRGPTLNGHLGLSVCAPGGAITSVPNWTLKKSMLMNGTSMSSPNAAGCLAVLLSALSAQNIPYSPYSIRRSIENTALKIENYDSLTHGHGLIQVDKAYEHLTQFRDDILIERDVHFHIKCSNNTNSFDNNLGIYLRSSFSTNKPSLHNITIEPIFLNDKLVDQKRKIEFEMSLSLVCDQQWVICPAFLHMSYSPRVISVKLDPTGLASGLHFSMIRAYDVKCPEKGPVFHIPITIIKPIEMPNKCQISEQLSLKPGQLNRKFICINRGMSGAIICIKNLDTRESGSFVLHTIQLRPQFSCRTNEFSKYFTLSADSDATYPLQVFGDGDQILEVVFGKWWASIGETNVEFSINFYGLTPVPQSVTMFASDSVIRVDAISSLSRHEDVSPNITFKYLVQPLRPVDTTAEVKPLYQRDIIPKGRQCYELVLTYALQISKAAQDVIISNPLLSELLYESEYESQLWMVFDCNKRLFGSGDAYSDRYQVKLEKGDYTIRLQIRHETVALLEKLVDLPLQIQYKLSSPPTLSCFESYTQALQLDGKKISGRSLQPYSECPFYIAGPKWSELAKNLPITASNGCYLLGSLTLTKDENRKKSETYTFKYVIDGNLSETSPGKKLPQNQNSKQSKSTDINNSNKDKTLGNNGKPIEEQFTEAINELKISWLPKLSQKSAEELYSKLLAQQNFIDDKINKASLILSRIQSFDTLIEDNNVSQDEKISYAKSQISLADEILNIIKVDDLLSALAVLKQQQSEKKTDNSSAKNDLNGEAKNLERQKSIIIDTLVKKGIAMCIVIEANNLKTNSNQINGFSFISAVNNDIVSSGDDMNNQISQLEVSTTSPKVHDVDRIYDYICKLVTDQYDNPKVAKLVERHAQLRQHFGRLLKLYLKQQESKPTLETERKCIEVFAELGWTHCYDAYKRSLYVKYPFNYRLF